jgi:hypothetical protein
MTGLPFILALSMVWLWPLIGAPLWMTTMAYIGFPFLALCLVIYFRIHLKKEADLVRLVGPEHALWADVGGIFSVRNTFSYVVSEIDLTGPSPTSDFILGVARRLGKTPHLPNYYEASSLAWSWCVLKLEDLSTRWPEVLTFVMLWSLNATLKWGAAYIKRLLSVIRVTLVTLVAIVFTSSNTFWAFLSGVVFFVSVFHKLLEYPWAKRIKLELTILAALVANAWTEYNFAGRKWLSKDGFRPRPGRRFGVKFGEMASKIAIVIADMGLPQYVLGSRKDSYTRKDLEETLSIMKDLGWPINVKLADPSRFGSATKYADWLFSGSTWAQGLHQREMYLDKLLDPLRVKAVEWRRTEEYRTYENEVRSIARYFKSPKYNFPDLNLDDVWFLLGDIFRNSKLTPFNYVIRMWEKKYSLGSFMVDPDNPRKKYSRWKFISTIGFKSFKDLWRRTFEVASKLTPVSHVSVKDEALSPKKYLADMVRTVVGSPISQYIMSTIWNYWPNHNFRWVETPIKVGMPLNGYWFDQIYSRHSRCQHHVAGDFSEFDSTVSAKILNIIRAVRKKGFESHKDVDRISKLIDINYDQVEHQLLNTTSTGDIYNKGTGLTTGHSSTTMDNSVACVVLYLMAWKDITGLDAKQFKIYNELSVFGDDHVLSFLSTKPLGWNFTNIKKSMRKFGVDLREEASGDLSNIPFLSKFVRRPTALDREDLEKAGVYPEHGWVVYHNRDRLIGKLVSKVKTMAPGYRLKRLLSYLSLTAHHPDVYAQLQKVISTTKTFSGIIKAEKIKIPTYNKVLKDWYSTNAVQPHTEMQDVDVSLCSEAATVHYGSVTLTDSLLSGLALVPDLINPVVFNYGFLRSFQSRWAHLCSWPIRLIRRSNDLVGIAEVSVILKRSRYDMLDPAIESNQAGETTSDLLLRHWMFLIWVHFTGGRRSTGVVATVHRKIADVQFAVNGKVQGEMNRFRFPIIDLTIIALLGMVRTPLDLSFPFNWVLPDLGDLYNRFTFWFYANFWSALPPNYADVVKVVRDQFKPGFALCVSAPTGTGKSTFMVKALADHAGHKFSKLIVIEPRSSIVKTTVPFTQVQLGLDCSGSTTGMKFDPESKVIYCTAQEFLLHASWWNHSNLIIMDEAHLKEEAYLLVRKILVEAELPRLYVSATVPPDLSHEFGILPLNTARVWTVQKAFHELPDETSIRAYRRRYLTEVVELLHNSPLVSKVLVFFPTVTDALACATQLGSRACVLSGSSGLPNLDKTPVVCCTSVADVGITLPNVDTVITSDIGFHVAHSMIESTPKYHRLSDDDITQRSGRTGRTNHGQVHIFQFPHMPVSSIPQNLETEHAVLSLLQGGVPVELVSKHCKSMLLKLLGLADIDGDAAEAIRFEALNQLSLYSNNLSGLLEKRALEADQINNTGEQAAVLDTARMGLLRPSTAATTQSLVQAVLKVSGLLGKRAYAGTRVSEVEEEIRAESAPLLGNINAKLPFPDPELGEWGMQI